LFLEYGGYTDSYSCCPSDSANQCPGRRSRRYHTADRCDLFPCGCYQDQNGCPEPGLSLFLFFQITWTDLKHRMVRKNIRSLACWLLTRQVTNRLRICALEGVLCATLLFWLSTSWYARCHGRTILAFIDYLFSIARLGTTNTRVSSITQGPENPVHRRSQQGTGLPRLSYYYTVLADLTCAD
jgi:hypothetical protein